MVSANYQAYARCPMDWSVSFGPIGPVIGAIIGAAATLTVGYFITHKRRRITFSLYKAEDVTIGLRKQNRHVALKFEDGEALNLNRARIRSQNTGNTAVGKFVFEIRLFQNLSYYYTDVISNTSNIPISIEPISGQGSMNELLVRVSVDFINPSEALDFVLWYDGPTVNPEVRCRIEDVKTIIVSAGTDDHIKTSAAPLTYQSMIVAATAAAIITGVATGVSTYFSQVDKLDAAILNNYSANKLQSANDLQLKQIRERLDRLKSELIDKMPIEQQNTNK